MKASGYGFTASPSRRRYTALFGSKGVFPPGFAKSNPICCILPRLSLPFFVQRM
jgi:hypothetical protein